MGCTINHVAPHGFRESEWMPCDLCVIFGMRHVGKRIIEEHNKRGVPCIVIDLGYVKRAKQVADDDGFWQVGLNGLNWIPDTAPNDRWKALEIAYPKPKKGGDYILIAEQVPDDASHGMIDVSIAKWTAAAVKKCEALGLPYKVRHHPLNKRIDPALLPKTTIEEDIAGAMAVYCHNSNTGNDALLAGVPVVCDNDCEYNPTYLELACGFENIKYPSNTKIRDYFHRLAYAQFTRRELADGSAFRYVLGEK